MKMKTNIGLNFDPHLMDMTIEQLSLIACWDCDTLYMDEYACPTYMQDNEAICSECCWCHDPEGGGQ